MAQFTLENEGIYAQFHPRGAALSRLIYKPLSRDVVLICDDPLAPHHNTNTIVGPIANRVTNACFNIGDRQIQLDQNEGENSLHCGRDGLSEVDWQASQGEDFVEFTTTLSDNLSRLLGAASYSVKYVLLDRALEINISATCEQDCAINLVPHLYFTMGTSNIENLNLMINADQYLPVDTQKLPTGEILPVANSPFDFRSPKEIGKCEVDHNFCLNSSKPAAILSYDGLAMRLKTDALGLQVYDAAHLGRKAIALEPQGWPDAVNRPQFPKQIVKANDTWSMRSVIELFETDQYRENSSLAAHAV